MRMRYRYVSYRYSDGSSLHMERYYRQLLHDALQQTQPSILQRSAAWRPFADIRESAEMMTVKIELAGMNEEDIDVTLYEDALVVSGERRDDTHQNDQLFYREAQVRYGPFRVEVLLLFPVDQEGVQARYENGFLWVDLPKLLEQDPKRVPVKERVPDEEL
jgi:HSP20 family protein